MTPLKIDFVSDVVCPWCVIGLRGLEIALERASDAVSAEITLHPFELNPAMPREGQNIVEHVAEKYGATPDQSDGNRNAIRERAAAVGFPVAMTAESRIWNTFDAHRLLHWAKEEGRQLALKHALFTAYFTENRDVADHGVLADAAAAAGLDRARAAAVLAEGSFAEAVRDEETQWRREGVTAVPTIVINDSYVISGGQPPEVFEKALRHIAAETAPAA